MGLVSTGLFAGGRVEGGIFLAPRGGGNSVVPVQSGAYARAPRAYYFGITASGGQAADMARIRRAFGQNPATPQAIATRPEGVPDGMADTWYDVTGLVPPFVVEKSGTLAESVGPNCYHAALAAAGYAVEGRYVGLHEFRSIIREDYEIVPPYMTGYGAIVLYHSNTPNEHAAFLLPGGLVFHKGGWETEYSYAITHLDEAIQHARSQWQPSREDRFGRPRNPWPEDSRTRVFYMRKQTVTVEERPASLQPALARFLPLVEFYCELLQAAAAEKWKTFPNNRIALLTIETMNKTGRDFAGAINAEDAPRSVKEVFFRFDSLLWQYEAMTKTYGGIRETCYEGDMRRLYEAQYVRFNEAFYREINLLLAFVGVKETDRATAVERVVACVREYNPLDFVRYNGSRGIPYLDIIREEAARVV